MTSISSSTDSDPRPKRTLLDRLKSIGWDDDCRGGSEHSIVTYLTVPFALPVVRTRDAGEGFIEIPNSDRGKLWMCVFLVVLFTTTIVLMMTSPQSPSGGYAYLGAGVFLVAGVSLLTPLVWAMWRRQTTSRRLVFLANRLELAIQTLRNGEDFVSEARLPLNECSLSLHPVRLGRSKEIWFGFSGWMVRATVGNRCFTLACVSQKEKAVEYLQQVPSWLLAIYTGEGEQVIGYLSDRTLGRT